MRKSLWTVGVMLAFFVVLLIGCVGLQKKEIPGLVDIEGQNPVPLVELCNNTVVEIESWELIDEQLEVAGEDSRGMIVGSEYSYRTYKYPDAHGLLYTIFYILEPFERAERLGIVMIHPRFGPKLIAIFDRYKNTELWYVFDAYEWDRQHPETIVPSPDRFKSMNNT